MGLFDKLAGAAQNAVENLKDGAAEASMMDAFTLCDALKGMKMLDPKALAYRQALRTKIMEMDDDTAEEIYTKVKKEGSLLKQHPAKEVVEDALVDMKLYIRNDDGILTKNLARKWFK